MSDETPSFPPWTPDQKRAIEDAYFGDGREPAKCPACGTVLRWGPGHDQWHTVATCTNCRQSHEFCWK